MRTTMVRYTLLRFLIFFGCLLVTWLAGVREDKVLLLLISAVASVIISFVLLRGMRDDMTNQIIERQRARIEARSAGRDESGAGDADGFVAGVDAEEDEEIGEAPRSER